MHFTPITFSTSFMKLQDRALLTRLRIESWGTTCKDKDANRVVSEALNSTDAATWVGKRLAPADALKAVKSKADAAREYVRGLTTPWTDDGARLLDCGQLFKLQDELRRTYKPDWQAEVDAVLARLDYFRDTWGPKNLGSLYDARLYPKDFRDEFGPDEPDIPLYIGYPITAASFRRKLVRDATGQTGERLMRQLMRNARSTDQRSRRTFWKMTSVQAFLLGAAVASGYWWLYPLLWLGPYLTVWRVINRLRSIAEHGGMQHSADKRESTHTVRQHLPARFLLVPYRIGWHLAHHVDSGVPFRNLPALHTALADAGYVADSFEYGSYPAIWRALRTQPSGPASAG